MEACLRNHFCHGKAICITYFECVSVALVIQHAMRMRRLISSCYLAGSTKFFPHYITTSKILVKNTKCVILLSLQLLSETLLILGGIQRDIIINVRKSSRRTPVIIVRFSLNLNFSRQIFENSTNTKFHENLSSEDQVVSWRRTEGQKDKHDETIVAFCNFADAPKIVKPAVHRWMMMNIRRKYV